MELFKNKVGRPSNATKRNRKMVVIVSVFAVLALFQSTVISYKNSKKNVNSKSMNVIAGSKKSGDVATAANCTKWDYKITEDDVKKIADISSGLNTVKSSRKKWADINGDGKTDKKDVVIATRIAAKLNGFMYGDLNKDGKLNSDDSYLAGKYKTKAITLTKKSTIEQRLADINADGKVNSADVTIIERISQRYGDICSAADLTKGDGKITQEDVDLALEFAGGYRTPTKKQIAAGDINGTGEITESDVRKISNKILIKNNLFGATAKTINGVKITYNSTLSYLTLNGTASGDIDLMRLLSQNIILNDEYTIKLLYLSGKITQSGSKFTVEIKDNNDESLVQRNYVNIDFPKIGSKTGTLKINSSAQANGNQLYVWITKGNNKLVFKNYKMKVEITKKFSTKLSEKSRITENKLRKVSTTNEAISNKKYVTNNLLANSDKLNMISAENMANGGSFNMFLSESNEITEYQINQSLNRIKGSNLNVKYNGTSITINGTAEESIPIAYISNVHYIKNDEIYFNYGCSGGNISVESTDINKPLYEVYSGIKIRSMAYLDFRDNPITLFKNPINGMELKLNFWFASHKGRAFMPLNDGTSRAYSFIVDATHEKYGKGIYLYISIPDGAKVTFNNYKLNVGIFEFEGNSNAPSYPSNPTTSVPSPIILPDISKENSSSNSGSTNTYPPSTGSAYTTISDGFVKLKYDINAISRDIGSQDQGNCHTYSIAYGSYIILGRKPGIVTDSVPTVNTRSSADFGGCFYDGYNDTNCSSISNINNYSDEYAIIKSKIDNGIPVSIHVKGQYYSEHWVLVVGYKNGVNSISSSGNELLKNVWVIDPVNGYNNREKTLWEGNPIDSARNSCEEMKDVLIRTWDTRASAK